MRLLNQFHQIMTTQIGAYGGIVEKYIGDAVMASFGAFDDMDCPAANALSAAQSMVCHVRDWQNSDLTDSTTPLQIGIGLNFGPAVVGDIGEGEAVTPAVIGASVNLAARLERATRTLDTDIIISDSFARKLRSETSSAGSALLRSFAKQDAIRVKGFSQPVTVHFQSRSAT